MNGYLDRDEKVKVTKGKEKLPVFMCTKCNAFKKYELISVSTVKNTYVKGKIKCIDCGTIHKGKIPMESYRELRK